MRRAVEMVVAGAAGALLVAAAVAMAQDLPDGPIMPDDAPQEATKPEPEPVVETRCAAWQVPIGDSERGYKVLQAEVPSDSVALPPGWFPVGGGATAMTYRAVSTPQPFVVACRGHSVEESNGHR